MSDPSPPGNHYITAATHVMYDEEGPVTAVLHYLTLHCFCGNSAGRKGDDPHEVFYGTLDDLHPAP